MNSDYLKSETAPKRIASRLKEMEAAITAAIEIFGISNVCRKWKDGDYESRFNRAVFDVVIGSLAQSSLRTWALKHKTQFENKFIACCKTDREFVASFETSTKNIAEVRKRFKTWYDAVEEISGIALKTPRITNSK